MAASEIEAIRALASAGSFIRGHLMRLRPGI